MRVLYNVVCSVPSTSCRFLVNTIIFSIRTGPKTLSSSSSPPASSHIVSVPSRSANILVCVRIRLLAIFSCADGISSDRRSPGNLFASGMWRPGAQTCARIMRVVEYGGASVRHRLRAKRSHQYDAKVYHLYMCGCLSDWHNPHTFSFVSGCWACESATKTSQLLRFGVGSVRTQTSEKQRTIRSHLNTIAAAGRMFTRSSHTSNTIEIGLSKLRRLSCVCVCLCVSVCADDERRLWQFYETEN